MVFKICLKNLLENLIVYAKGDAGVIPSDAIIAKLAGEGVICAVKRACDSAAFETTVKAVQEANPAVLKIQGAAERFVPGVVGIHHASAVAA